jgi:flagellar hook assembly protein FlgD
VLNESPLILEPGQIDTLVILGDLNIVSTSTSFNFKVADIFAYVGEAGSEVSVVDEDGTKFSESDQGTSEIVSILSEKPEDQFFNYPNPFGENDKITRFVFYLERPGTVEIKIYNLLGGLVRTLSQDIAEGDRVIDGYGRLTWDGYNEVGNRVLNGVYIAILKANGQTYKTKIAYIK